MLLMQKRDLERLMHGYPRQPRTTQIDLSKAYFAALLVPLGSNQVVRITIALTIKIKQLTDGGIVDRIMTTTG